MVLGGFRSFHVLVTTDISHWSLKKNVLVLAMINPLLTKLVQSRYLDIGLVLFCVFIDLDFFSVHKKRTKKWPISSHLDLTLGQ